METTREATAPDVPPAGSPPAQAPRGRFHGLTANRQFQGLVSPIAFLIISAFWSVANRVLDAHSNTPILLLGLSVMLTLLAGQFDLSVASMTTLVTYLTVGLTVNYGWPFWIVLVCCLLAGAIGGVVNGLLVTKVRINTFIATLGTGGVFLGLSSVLSGGSSIVPTPEAPLPGWFSGIGSFGQYTTKVPLAASLVMILGLLVIAHISAQRLRPQHLAPRRWLLGEVIVASGVLLLALVGRSWLEQVTWPVYLLIATAGVLWVVLRLTVTGRNIQATGSSPLAARLAGVRTEREIIKSFMFGGLLAAMAGIVLAAQQGAATPDVATGFLLPAFAAAFLSTVVFSAGRFSVWGTVIGGCFLLWVGQGLIIGGLPFTWLPVVNGIVLILAVASSTYIRREQR
jgi:ribose/xylose/arabinose/galactoside ABC-type transport system permease subunit